MHCAVLTFGTVQQAAMEIFQNPPLARFRLVSAMKRSGLRVSGSRLQQRAVLYTVITYLLCFNSFDRAFLSRSGCFMFLGGQWDPRSGSC